jgi:hypothetical protein
MDAAGQPFGNSSVVCVLELALVGLALDSCLQ